jgi:hypothetical protein
LRRSCSRRCYASQQHHDGVSPALAEALSVRRATDGDPEIRRRRYGRWAGKKRDPSSNRKTSLSLRRFHRERGMKPLGTREVTASGYMLVLVRLGASKPCSRRRATDGAVWMFEHRLIMEHHLGRRLRRDEVVHHVDHDRTNNALANLVLMDPSDHTRTHAAERRIVGTCASCGREFEGRHYTRRYCSRSCSLKAWRAGRLVFSRRR